MPLTVDELRRIAVLSGIELSAETEAALHADLDAWEEGLSRLPASGSESARIFGAAEPAEDRVADSDSTALGHFAVNAPRLHRQFLAVPALRGPAARPRSSADD